MITSFSLANFKSFKKLENFGLSSLTVIAGRNSCGKSSILQSLLLLKQTLISKDATALELDGEYLIYTNLKEIAYSLPPVNKAMIGYSFNLKTETMEGTIEISFKNKKEGDHYTPHVKDIKIKANSDKYVNFEKLKPVNFKKENNILFENLNIKNALTKYINFIPVAINAGLEDKDKDKDKDKAGYKNRTVQFPLGFLFRDENEILDVLGKELRNIKYLGPVRATPKRAYVHFSEVARELLPSGENAAHILWARQNELVLFEGKKHKLKDALNLCIATMGLSQQITPTRIGNLIYQLKLSQTNCANEVTISDVGFGYSQVIPIILLCLLSNPGNLIILEQPEIHLHPSSCANLADLFIKFIQDGRRILLETHSSELINRLRLRVIEKPEMKEKISIAFVENDKPLNSSDHGIKNEGSTVKQFQIDENGMFPVWPEGFLDESDKLAEAILKARIDSRKKPKTTLNEIGGGNE